MDLLGYRQEEIFPLRVDRHGCPSIEARVGGMDLDLTLDTGNMSGLLLASSVASRLGLAVVGESRALDSTGEVLRTDRVFRVGRVELLGSAWPDVRAHEDRRDEVAGYVGPAFFRGKRFTIDVRRRWIAVSAAPLPPAARGDALSMIPSPRHEGLVLVRGSANGREVLVEIDTGKSRTCVDPELAASLGLPRTRDGYRIDEVRLGPRTFGIPSAKEVGFRGISEGLPAPILLGAGADVVSHVVLTVSYLDAAVLLGD